MPRSLQQLQQGLSELLASDPTQHENVRSAKKLLGGEWGGELGDEYETEWTPEMLKQLAHHFTRQRRMPYEITNILAKHPKTDGELFRHLVATGSLSDESHKRILSHPGTPEDLLRDMAREVIDGYSSEGRMKAKRLLESPRVNSEVLADAIRQSKTLGGTDLQIPVAVAEMAQHPKFGSDAIHALIEHAEKRPARMPQTALFVGRSPNLDESHIDRILRAPKASTVRHGYNTDTPALLINGLAENKKRMDSEVIKKVLKHTTGDSMNYGNWGALMHNHGTPELAEHILEHHLDIKNSDSSDLESVIGHVRPEYLLQKMDDKYGKMAHVFTPKFGKEHMDAAFNKLKANGQHFLLGKMLQADSDKNNHITPDQLQSILDMDSDDVQDSTLTSNAAKHANAKGNVLRNVYNRSMQTGKLDNSIFEGMVHDPNLSTDELLKLLQKGQLDERFPQSLKGILGEEMHKALIRNRAGKSGASGLSNQAVEQLFSHPAHAKHAAQVVINQPDGKFAKQLRPHHWSQVFKHGLRAGAAEQAKLLGADASMPGYGGFLRAMLKSGNSNVNYSANSAFKANWAKINPDSVFNRSVNVKMDTHKLRQVRDHMAASGKEALPPKQIPMWNEHTMKHLKDKRGNINLAVVEQEIDKAPTMRYNVSHSVWKGGQRHNTRNSKVFQLNLSSDHIDRLKKAGLWDEFQRINDKVNTGGHPTNPHTLGWVRWTGHPGHDVFIDEIQSDIWKPLARRLAEEKVNEDEYNHGVYHDPDARQAALKKYYELASQEYNPDEHKKVMDIVFGERHPGEVLHEAFLQHMRDKGHANTKITMHTSKSKAPLSGLDPDEPVPVHAKETYDKAPKAMGYQQSQYGNRKLGRATMTQVVTNTPEQAKELRAERTPDSNTFVTVRNRGTIGGQRPDARLKDAPVWHDKVRKAEERLNEIQSLLRKLKEE